MKHSINKTVTCIRHINMYHEYELVTPFNISPSPDNGCVYHRYIKSFTILTADSIVSKCTLYTMLLLTQANNTFTVLVVMSHSWNTLSFWSGKTPRYYIKIKKHYNIYHISTVSQNGYQFQFAMVFFVELMLTSSNCDFLNTHNPDI